MNVVTKALKINELAGYKGLPVPVKLAFTGNAVMIAIHFGIRAVSQEELRFLVGMHLAAILAAITLKLGFQRLPGGF